MAPTWFCSFAINGDIISFPPCNDSLLHQCSKVTSSCPVLSRHQGKIYAVQRIWTHWVPLWALAQSAHHLEFQFPLTSLSSTLPGLTSDLLVCNGGSVGGVEDFGWPATISLSRLILNLQHNGFSTLLNFSPVSIPWALKRESASSFCSDQFLLSVGSLDLLSNFAHVTLESKLLNILCRHGELTLQSPHLCLILNHLSRLPESFTPESKPIPWRISTFSLQLRRQLVCVILSPYQLDTLLWFSFSAHQVAVILIHSENRAGHYMRVSWHFLKTHVFPCSALYRMKSSHVHSVDWAVSNLQRLKFSPTLQFPSVVQL